MDRLSHHRYSKATPPVEAPPPLNPLITATPDPSNPLAVLSGKNPGSSLSPGPTSNPSGASPSASPTLNKKGPVNMVVGGPWQPLQLTAENASDIQLLTPAEQQLCNNLRIKPKPYLVIKEQLLKEAIKQGGVLKKRTAREVSSVSVPSRSVHHWMSLMGMGTPRLLTARKWKGYMISLCSVVGSNRFRLSSHQDQMGGSSLII